MNDNNVLNEFMIYLIAKMYTVDDSFQKGFCTYLSLILIETICPPKKMPFIKNIII